MKVNNISVALIGIPTIEEKRLDAAFLHSQTRHTSYFAEEISHSPQILMVNADEPAALIKWRKYRNTLEAEGKKEPPSVLVSKVREFKTVHYQVRLPLIASRTISVLDQVTDKEFAASKEVAILDQTLVPTPKIENQTSREEGRPATDVAALVIDDSLPVRVQMDQALRPFTERIDFAESGEEAFELVNSNKYNIIFLDIVLPGMDGYEVCKVIKQGKAKHTPIIMLTGNSSPADRIKGKLAGCDTYLIKPVRKTVFKEMVSQYLSLRVTASAI